MDALIVNFKFKLGSAIGGGNKRPPTDWVKVVLLLVIFGLLLYIKVG